MSDILVKFTKLKKFSQNLKHEIRLFLVFDDHLGKNCVYFTTDDQCYAFGSNLVGCLGFGHSKFVEEPQLVPELCHKNVTDCLSSELACVIASAVFTQSIVFTLGSSAVVGANSPKLSFEPA